MKNRLLISILLGLPLWAFCQGTDLKVIGFSQSICEPDSGGRRQVRERIIDRKRNSSNTKIQIGVWATCCVNFKPVARAQNDTLFLDVEDTLEKAPCECGCYYKFTFEIDGLVSDPLEIRYKGRPITVSSEKYETYPLLYRLVKGDTINRVDKYGLRQGKWIASSDSLFIGEYFVYEDGLVSSKVNLYPSGQIKKETTSEILKEANSESHYGRGKKIIEYYESGKKKRECYLDFFDNGPCTEWNEKGNVVYKGNFRK